MPDDQGRLGVAVLGSAGSIGRQTLDVLDRLPGRFRIVALATGRSADVLAEQAARHRPAVVALSDLAAVRALELPTGTRAIGGDGALGEIATHPEVDVVVVATGGVVSLLPVLAALEAGKLVGIANKETLVAGGHLVMPLARRRAPHDPLSVLRPIDSEHSAIWQCLVGEKNAAIDRLILTASGGPFRGTSREALAAVTPAQALAHPTWRMGAKITIDSATLANKGLEVIEAHWLYDVDYDAIDVVIHPQSIIHSAVQFVDGSLKAQLGTADMRLPIQYALTYPDRLPSPATPADLLSLGRLEFEAPDEARFPALAVARDAGRRGSRASATLIAADEVAVERFLAGSLSFPGIPALLSAAVERYDEGSSEPGLEEIVALDAEVRCFAAAWAESR